MAEMIEDLTLSGSITNYAEVKASPGEVLKAGNVYEVTEAEYLVSLTGTLGSQQIPYIPVWAGVSLHSQMGLSSTPTPKSIWTSGSVTHSAAMNSSMVGVVDGAGAHSGNQFLMEPRNQLFRGETPLDIFLNSLYLFVVGNETFTAEMTVTFRVQYRERKSKGDELTTLLLGCCD